MRRAGSWSGIAGVIGALAVLALQCGAQSDARAQSGDVSPSRRHEVVVTIRNGLESSFTLFFLDAAFEHHQSHFEPSSEHDGTNLRLKYSEVPAPLLEMPTRFWIYAGWNHVATDLVFLDDERGYAPLEIDAPPLELDTPVIPMDPVDQKTFFFALADTTRAFALDCRLQFHPSWGPLASVKLTRGHFSKFKPTFDIVRLRVRPDGFGSQTFDLPPIDAKHLQTGLVAIKYPPCRLLHFELVDPKGNPAVPIAWSYGEKEVDVRVHEPGAERASLIGTDHDQALVFLPPSPNWRMDIEVGGYETVSLPIWEGPDDPKQPRRIEVVPYPIKKLQVRIVDEQGKPVVGAAVSAAKPVLRSTRPSSVGTTFVTTRTGEDGRVDLDCPRRTTDVVVTADGLPQVATQIDAAVENDETVITHFGERTNVSVNVASALKNESLRRSAEVWRIGERGPENRTRYLDSEQTSRIDYEPTGRARWVLTSDQRHYDVDFHLAVAHGMASESDGQVVLAWVDDFEVKRNVASTVKFRAELGTIAMRTEGDFKRIKLRVEASDGRPLSMTDRGDLQAGVLISGSSVTHHLPLPVGKYRFTVADPEFESTVSEVAVRKDETTPLVIRPKRRS